jgi:hypothetical protein
LADKAQTVATLKTSTKVPEQTPTLPVHQVRFFSRPSWGDEAAQKLGEEPRRKAVSLLGHVALSGLVHFRAYSHPKQKLEEALADLKADLAHSLRVRLELSVEEAERLEEEEEQAETSAGASEGLDGAAGAVSPQPRHHLLEEEAINTNRPFGEGMPRRVLVPWLAGVQLSEYLTESESLVDAEERCRDMLGASFVMLPGGQDLVEVEAPSTSRTAVHKQSEREGSESATQVSVRDSMSKNVSRSTCSQTTLAATVGALAAASLAAGLAYTMR